MSIKDDAILIAQHLKGDIDDCISWCTIANSKQVPNKYVGTGFYGSYSAAERALKGEYIKSSEGLMKVIDIVPSYDGTDHPVVAILIKVLEEIKMHKWLIITQTSLNDTEFLVFESDDPEKVWDKVMSLEGTGRGMAIQLEDITRFLLVELPQLYLEDEYNRSKIASHHT